MRFMVAECTGPSVARWLRDQGYTVFSVYEEARGATDGWLLQKAQDEDWILITNDKDFGQAIYRERQPHRGVILLRLDDERPANKIRTVRRLIEAFSDKLPGHFVVATERRVRFA